MWPESDPTSGSVQEILFWQVGLGALSQSGSDFWFIFCFMIWGSPGTFLESGVKVNRERPHFGLSAGDPVLAGGAGRHFSRLGFESEISRWLRVLGG